MVISVGAAAAIVAACTSGSATSPTATSCPPSEPSTGDPCAGSLHCFYGTMKCGLEDGPIFNCVDGKWVGAAMVAGCNPGAPIDSGFTVPTADAGDDAAETSSDASSSGDSGDSGD